MGIRTEHPGHQRWPILLAFLLPIALGCSSSNVLELDAAVDSGSDQDSGVTCGANTCAVGEVCCNASCGICTAPGGSCSALECIDGGVSLDGGACTNPILCVAPPKGCRYVNASCTSCGTLDCGGECGADVPVPCAETEYCAYRSGCGNPGERGVCTQRGSGDCPDFSDPVCGCDENDYDNACGAHNAGVNVDFTGTCEMPSRCGGRGGAPCSADEWCDFGQCQSSGGTCRIRPTGCPRISDPVCGCGGTTYTNKCLAHAAGADVASRGACPDA